MNTSPRTNWLSIALNLFGVGVVIWALATVAPDRPTVSVFVIGALGVGAWLAAIVARIVVGGSLGDRRFVVLLLAAMAITGSLVAAPTNGVGIALVVAALIRTLSVPTWPLWWGGALTLASAAVVAVGTVVFAPISISALGLLALEGGILIAAIGGYSRRQARVAEQQTIALREERLHTREEQARLSVLSERAQLARDIHDVLAHSLGGLVIQLDAVDALLEAGAIDAAGQRVRDARVLAADGLAEARRAVDALREPDAASTVTAADLVASLDDLVAATRRLGALTEFARAAAPEDAAVSAESAAALRRTLQEGLTNARKHAPGAPVHVALSWHDAGAGRDDGGEVVLHITNPLRASGATSLAASGGGNGLRGMAERFANLPGAAIATGAANGEFVVEARLPLATRAGAVS